MAWGNRFDYGDDSDEMADLLRQYLAGGQGLLGTAGADEYGAMPPPVADDFMSRFASSPMTAFGMGVLSNNVGPYGAAGPALGEGLKSMQVSQLANRKSELERSKMLAKYQAQQQRERAIDQLDIPDEQKQMLRADPAAARMMMAKHFGWDADSPAAHAQKLSRAAAGGTRVSVGGPSIMLPGEDKELGKEVPGRFLDEFKTGRDKVASGLSSWGTWQRIENAANSGAFVGPAADKRLGLAQIGDWLGMTGKDTQETMANTRRVIQGFAELALNARDLLKGQGQITENEQKLAAQAMSGQYTEMSPTEVITLARLGRRASIAQAAEHNRRIEDFASRDPRYAEIARHYKQAIPRHMWPVPTERAKASLRAAKDSPGYVEAFRKQFGPEWTDEVLGAQ